MTAEETKAFVCQPGEAKSIALGDNLVTIIARGSDTGGIYSLSTFTMAPPPTPGPVLHVHTDAHEAMYILEGELDVRIGDQTVRASAGSFVFVPKGTPHLPSNPGPRPAKILAILTPPGYEGYFEEVAQHMAAGSPPDPALLLSLQEKYHMETGGQVRQFTIPSPGQAG